MMKEKSINPAQAARKAEKAKAIKKGKAEAASRRNEKLARRNPDRLQKQLDDLKAIESGGGKLTTHERKLLEQLEKDVKAVRKARDTLGVNDSRPPRAGPGDGGYRDGGYSRRDEGSSHYTLGKRRREQSESDDSDVPEDVKKIPMPRDTPPPIPKDVMDRWWAKRRERQRGPGGGRDYARQDRKESAPQPPVETKTVYEAAPQIRDLRKEATSARFMPAAVREKMDRLKGAQGSKLLEPEEADQLEKEGYTSKPSETGEQEGEAEDPRLEKELEEFSRHVQMEEVDDEDG